MPKTSAVVRKQGVWNRIRAYFLSCPSKCKFRLAKLNLNDDASHFTHTATLFFCTISNLIPKPENLLSDVTCRDRTYADTQIDEALKTFRLHILDDFSAFCGRFLLYDTSQSCVPTSGSVKCIPTVHCVHGRINKKKQARANY